MAAHDREPLMQLLYPSLPGILNRGVQENDLVLYPNLMNDRLQSHLTFISLVITQSLVPTTFVRDISKDNCASNLLLGLVELGTP